MSLGLVCLSSSSSFRRECRLQRNDDDGDNMSYQPTNPNDNNTRRLPVQSSRLKKVVVRLRVQSSEEAGFFIKLTYANSIKLEARWKSFSYQRRFMQPTHVKRQHNSIWLGFPRSNHLIDIHDPLSWLVITYTHCVCGSLFMFHFSVC